MGTGQFSAGVGAFGKGGDAWALASLSRPQGDFLSYKWVDLTGNVT